jgi:uncharacterized OB-fold protein
MAQIEPRTRGWVEGDDCIVFQRCNACGHVWYFWRDFCPCCGAGDPHRNRAAGTGRVCAISLVCRAPSDVLREHAPYLVILVDVDEGFRLMAQGEKSLAIGDRVRATYVDFGGQLIPFFVKA